MANGKIKLMLTVVPPTKRIKTHKSSLNVYVSLKPTFLKFLQPVIELEFTFSSNWCKFAPPCDN